MKNYKVLIDAGHGGVLFGRYMTSGKRSPGKKTEEDFGIFEGDFNREIAQSLQAKLIVNDVDAEVLNNSAIDVSMHDRVKTINVFPRHDNILVVSIHANASGATWSKANGFKIFIAKRASLTSHTLSASIEKNLKKSLKGKILSRGISQRNFAILTQTIFPAVLIECGFMTSKKEVEKLMGLKTQSKIADGIIDGILGVIK